MPELWRLTRNRYGRAAYDALARAGVTATRLVEYVRPLADPADPTPAPAAAALPDATPDAGVSVGAVDPGTVVDAGAPVEELRADEEVVAAREDGATRGYLFCSVDAVHRVHPLEEDLSFDGAYVRRVFVDPDHRRRRVATALVAAACRRAADRGARRATALVAVDNRPSRLLFERTGFEPRRVHTYARVGPLARRSMAPARR